MGTVDTGRASKFRLSERQVGWRLPYPRLRRRPSISGPRFIESPQSANSRRNNQEGEHRNTSFWAIGASTVYHAAVAWPVQSETCN